MLRPNAVVSIAQGVEKMTPLSCVFSRFSMVIRQNLWWIEKSTLFVFLNSNSSKKLLLFFQIVPLTPFSDLWSLKSCKAYPLRNKLKVRTSWKLGRKAWLKHDHDKCLSTRMRKWRRFACSKNWKRRRRWRAASRLPTSTRYVGTFLGQALDMLVFLMIFISNVNFWPYTINNSKHLSHSDF